eukprot:2228695-Pyramimonas_sp.AAC.2
MPKRAMPGPAAPYTVLVRDLQALTMHHYKAVRQSAQPMLERCLKRFPDLGLRGGKWERAGNWTRRCEQGKGLWGVECILAVIRTGGPGWFVAGSGLPATAAGGTVGAAGGRGRGGERGVRA